jgi:hypothetical protein
MKYAIYIFFNIVFQVIIFWCLLFANTYLNDWFIPEGLLWKNNVPRMDNTGLFGNAAIRTLILFLEAAIMLLVIYAINKGILTEPKNTKIKVIANRTARIQLVLTFLFIGLLIWGGFKGSLW